MLYQFVFTVYHVLLLFTMFYYDFGLYSGHEGVSGTCVCINIAFLQ